MKGFSLFAVAMAMVAALACGPAGAANGFYQVEVIVIGFEQQRPTDAADASSAKGSGEERFDRSRVVLIPPAADGSIDLDDPVAGAGVEGGSGNGNGDGEGQARAGGKRAAKPEGIVIQPGRSLLPEVARLNADPGIRVLHYVGWLQPSASSEEVGRVAIRIRSPGGADDPSDVEGYVHVYTSGPFLQTTVDLRYRAPGGNEPVPAASPLRLAFDTAPLFHLYEQRRVRLRETNYYDHPRIGVLLLAERHGESSDVEPSDATASLRPLEPGVDAPPPAGVTPAPPPPTSG